MIRETIEWFDVSERMPDDEETVLIHAPESSEPVWLGWHEDGQWYEVSAMPIDGVKRWAVMPSGGAPT